MGRPRTATFKVNESTECWEWQGKLNSSGYGQHRRVYQEAKGILDPEVYLDHLCKNRSCVNPEHLETVSNAENQRRRHNHGCSKGHAFTEENTYIGKTGWRYCRTCRAHNTNKFREKKAKANE
jgi:hypothetical protein